MIKSLFMLMLKNPLFVMSLSGTTVFIVYLLTYPLLKRYFSLKWRYRILKIAMLFYLFPFPLYRDKIWGFFRERFSFVREMARQYKFSKINTDYVIVVNSDSIWLSPKVKSIYIAVSLIVLISLFILWKQAAQYRKMKQIHFSELEGSAEEKTQEIFLKKKEMLQIKRKIRFICSEYCESPITIGVRAPIILFPIRDKNNMLDDELCEYLITHELVHIKHYDVLFKLIGLLAAAVHWFNPFVYLLINELSCISEMYCDSVVMEGKGEKERYKYENLLLNFITENSSGDNGEFGMCFVDFKKKAMYKRRILEMKGRKTKKTFLSAVMAVFICMAGVGTVFAYCPPLMINDENGDFLGADEVFVREESEQTEELISDYFAVSDDGTVYDLCNTDENARATCDHDYSISVEVTRHRKDGRGGCTVKIYSGLKCSKCSAIKTSELLSTVTYMPCPH